ncbi:unnamed protein product [Rotaria sp. Silwood1]|nr:unnamed protein product [Rotaria sp. Silwood1]CAF1664184.1 unnamed protein product [Rotaria sp. Silwood1]
MGHLLHTGDPQKQEVYDRLRSGLGSPKDDYVENSGKEKFCKLLEAAGALTMSPHGIDVKCASIHELFDMRMRVIDALGSKWTSWEWEPLMNQFNMAIDHALDAAKTGNYVETIEWSALWRNKCIPKYPHFYPTKDLKTKGKIIQTYAMNKDSFMYTSNEFDLVK